MTFPNCGDVVRVHRIEQVEGGFDRLTIRDVEGLRNPVIPDVDPGQTAELAFDVDRNVFA